MNKLEQSEAQAEIIKMIAMWLPQLDLPFLKQAGQDMQADAIRQDSMAVLSMKWNPDKTRILEMKGAALLKLVEYAEAIEAIQEATSEMARKEGIQNEIDKLFS